MKILKKIALFTFIGTLFITCKKEVLPPSTIAQPVFSFSGNIGGTNLNLQAGVNNYYMYSSYMQDSVGANKVIYGFTATLQNINTAKNSIQIIINDKDVTTPNASAAAHIDTALSPSLSYGYNIPGGDSVTKYSIQFTPVIVAGTPLSYSYNFGDSNTSIVASPTHVYATTGTYATSLAVHFTSGNANMSNPITIVSAQPQLWIDAIYDTLTVHTATTATIQFSGAISGGAAPYKYTWNYGDGSPIYSTTSIGLANTATHTYDSINKAYLVNLTVKDNNNNTETYNYAVYASDTTIPASVNLMNYKMSSPQKITTSIYPLSDVTINYTDDGGNKYTSNNTSQPIGSKFLVLSVSNYQNNLNNNPTKMLKVTFNCMLYPVLGGAPITATNCTAVIAVAYH